MVTSINAFAGIGGWNIAEKALGIRTLMAANHSAPSLATNSLNFPETEQANLDIMTCDASAIPDADILTASPECTNFTTGKGIKLIHRDQPTLMKYIGYWTDRSDEPFIQQSRETMKGVYRWAEIKMSQGKPFKMIFVENVTEIKHWGDLKNWYEKMEHIGYEHTTISFNSMFARPMPSPVPQNRDRCYIIFWLRGMPAPDMDIQPLAYCKRCLHQVHAIQCWKSSEPYGDYGAQYVYHCPNCNKPVVPHFTAAHTIIDWTLPTSKIGDRKKPLVAKTVGKIQKGLQWYTRIPHNGEIKAFLLSYYGNACYKSVYDAAGTCTKKDRHALITMPENWTGGMPDINECGFRMLHWTEYKALMGIPEWFRFDCSATEAKRQLGLAVTPAAAAEVLSRGIASLKYVTLDQAQAS